MNCEASFLFVLLGMTTYKLCLEIQNTRLKTMPNARHGYCCFHALRRNFTDSPQYKAVLAAAKNKSILARAEIDVFIRWMWYFAKHYETVEEINISAELLKLYMTEDQDSHFAVHEEEFRRLLTEFMTSSYLEKGHKMFDAYMPGMTLAQITSSGNESYHCAVKYVADGPRPCHDLNELKKKTGPRGIQSQSRQSKAE